MYYKVSKLHNNYNLDIDIIEIENSNNYKIKFSTLGGYIHEVLIPTLNDPTVREDVLLGYNKFEDILQSDGYFNSIIGRVCNRIGKSKFKINEKEYYLFSNAPPHHLHGGREGFNKKIWKLENIKKEQNYIQCTLSYFSMNLEENYPGNLQCKAIYELNNNNEIIIKFIAKSDQDTIVNITNHNYWNFHGHAKFYKSIEGHSVKIYSEKICENNKDLIPTGNLIDIKKTKYDFINHNLITTELLKNGGIDNNYDIGNNKLLKKAAEVYSTLTRMGVVYYTDQPGIQFYTGNMMQKYYNGKKNRKYGVNYGLCLEPQFFPDAINQENFKSPILKIGEQYQSNITMKLYNNF